MCAFGKCVLRFPNACMCFSLFFFFLDESKCLTFSVNSAYGSLFTEPQILFFNNFFIKNGFYSIIHTFKNYFVIIFLIFSISKISFKSPTVIFYGPKGKIHLLHFLSFIQLARSLRQTLSPLTLRSSHTNQTTEPLITSLRLILRRHSSPNPPPP